MSNVNCYKPVYVSVGSNDNAETHIRAGILLLNTLVYVKRCSIFYWGEAVNLSGANPYLNGVILIETDLDFDPLKALLKRVEDDQGRIRVDEMGKKSKKVTLDLDILLYEGQPLHADILTRDFVAMPLAELAPTILHPVIQETFQQIAERMALHTTLQKSEFTPSLNEN
jgi:2-amino-4-hydroxy-6-hydroxymethyldihydropteridine diphosphokinase